MIGNLYARYDQVQVAMDVMNIEPKAIISVNINTRFEPMTFGQKYIINNHCTKHIYFLIVAKLYIVK